MSSPSPYRAGSTTFALWAALRVGTANLSPITDCDEVFNYWEPLHFVLYGTGMQTWEYAPQYALRTYAYILPLAAAAKCLRCIFDRFPLPIIRNLSALLLLPRSSSSTSFASYYGGDKPLLFAALRSLLALTSSLSELAFLDAVHGAIGPDVAHWTAISSLAAAGNFHAGPALLPSSTVMVLWRMSATSQLREERTLAIFWGLLAVLVSGWPFCAVLFVTTGLWALWRAGLGRAVYEGRIGRSELTSVAVVLLRVLLLAAAIQSLVMVVDYNFYGRVVSPTWNIFVYNARSGGDELYGVEPLSFYWKNLLLNFNLVAPLGMISLPLLMMRNIMTRLFSSGTSGELDERCGAEALVLVPMYVWLAMVSSRPHKEERFLFPIYPMLCFGAAITVREALDLSKNWLNSPSQGKGKCTWGNNARLFLGLAVLVPSVVISASRSLALHNYYTAPLLIYGELYSHATASRASLWSGEITYVCTAGEWHRFPSSFFLPPNHQLGFLKSSFTGQLPQPFTEFGSSAESTAVQSGSFNDVNMEETDRYVDIEQCSYVVELVPSQPTTAEEEDVPECLRYMELDLLPDTWTQLASRKYLDVESTPLLHRILFIPLGRDDKVSHKEYNLYARDR